MLVGISPLKEKWNNCSEGFLVILDARAEAIPQLLTGVSPDSRVLRRKWLSLIFYDIGDRIQKRRRMYVFLSAF
jgi:hypothetical protein